MTKKIEVPAITREQWLQNGIALLRREFEGVFFDIFGDEGAEHLDKISVTVGWPSTRGASGKVIGECWNSKSTSDGQHHIFISPILDSPVRVLDVLLHEMIHAADDGTSKHKGKFVKCARACGLEGKPTATVAGEETRERLIAIAEELGEFPHSVLKPWIERKVQKTYMLKFMCAGITEYGEDAEPSEFLVRTTQKMIDEYGAPICPCHHGPMVQEVKE